MYFQNYFGFCIGTLKTRNTKVVHLNQIYNFDLCSTPNFAYILNHTKCGKSRGRKISVFPN